MTLGRKIVLGNSALLVALVVLGWAATQGLLGLRHRVGAALLAYRELQHIETAETDVTAAEVDLSDGRIDHQEALVASLKSAKSEVDAFLSVEGYDYATGDAATAIADVRAASGNLNELVSMLGPGGGQLSVAEISRRVNVAVAALHQAATACDSFIADQRLGTESEFHSTLLAVSILALAIVLAAAAVSIWQYRSVVLPLRRLREGVREVAAGKFEERIDIAGDAEFSQLADEFNAMAEKLDDFYRRLEEKVAEKSRELVRSERLASVGFLAAGVAHEINNPLNIISGYAELSLKKLGAGNGSNGAAEPINALKIIRDEAFRCKEITQKLLSLARGSDESQTPVSLAVVAEEVAALIRGLNRYSDRRLIVDMEDSIQLTVMGSVTEIKQVLLNLTINALEATPPGSGEVCIMGRRNEGMVEISVKDNGKGMSRATIERVFEPFYTEKRGPGEPGTGLGLTITHAIIENHGGQILAQSEGPGQGSRFVVRLPVARRKTAGAGS